MTEKLRVLFVDDEVEDDSSKVETLREMGFDVVVVNEAREVAPQIARSAARFDAVILDIMMPFEDYSTAEDAGSGRFTGVLVLRDIRERLGDIPVLVVSAHNKAEITPKLQDVEILEKPVSARQVAEKLKQLLGSRS